MATINLFGASGHAMVIMDIINANGNTVGQLYDDAPSRYDIHGVPVFKATDISISGPMIVSIGSNYVRKKIVARYPHVKYSSALHPSATISPTAHIDAGTVVMQGAVIQAEARIGRHCIVNTGASIDHECILEDYVHISPHATLCGNVYVGEGSWIGAGAVVIPGIRIGNWCVIGAGATVIRDVPDGMTVYGTPAKSKEENNEK